MLPHEHRQRNVLPHEHRWHEQEVLILLQQLLVQHLAHAACLAAPTLFMPGGACWVGTHASGRGGSPVAACLAHACASFLYSWPVWPVRIRGLCVVLVFVALSRGMDTRMLPRRGPRMPVGPEPSWMWGSKRPVAKQVVG